MIPRAELEFTLAMAEKGLRSETPPEVMAELCRVYLAYRDAPEGEVWQHMYAGGQRTSHLIITREPEDGLAIIGKRVKLVEIEQ